MTTTIKPLVPAKFAENTQTTQYTASNVRASIDKFTGTNVTSANVTLTVNIIPNGGTVGSSNIVSQTRTIAPGETHGFPDLVGQYLEPGGVISTIASASSSIVLRVSGREIA